MAVSEYSDTVMETMNKTHNEIMFLYSMLNDKQTEMTEVVGALQKYSKATKNIQQEYIQPVVEQPVVIEKHVEEAVAPVIVEEPVKRVAEEELVGTQESMFLNKNEQIILLHKEGKSEVDIAKALDCGLGEVRLVLGLFTEEGNK